ncbi:NAD(P)/FAD-dependent oxidoreductase [Paenarthrobacter sp. NEAU-H11]|uniref:NAD(P)/FAD-dependent oxidoreductase n=1 Tax=Paenarthrobacter sp. NEAU-H11 TaxID=3423924 RepID=UPI003D349615
MSARIVVVGGSLGGQRSAEQLRAKGWDGEIVVIGAEHHPPYQRPPLSKAVLTDEGLREPAAADLLARPDVALRQRPGVEGITWITGHSAVGLDLASRTVAMDDGSDLAFDGLILATGLRPRRLALEGGTASRHVLRTLEDAISLRAALQPGVRVAVVGAGFIGCEVAASAVARGCDVTVIEPLAQPMLAPLGARLARAMRQHHEDRGVRFSLNRVVTALRTGSDDRDRIEAVGLDDGSEIPATLVVEAVGSVPNVDWLSGTGLDLSNGLLCDGSLRVEGHQGIVAVGDVARFPNPRFDDVPRRVEHWSMPADTAVQAAVTLMADLGRPVPGGTGHVFAPLPSFWSDQFDVRVQGYGTSVACDETRILEGDFSNGWKKRGVTVGHHRNGRLVGCLVAGGTPAQRMKARRLVEESTMIKAVAL